jgi:hypothetical protein
VLETVWRVPPRRVSRYAGTDVNDWSFGMAACRGEAAIANDCTRNVAAVGQLELCGTHSNPPSNPLSMPSTPLLNFKHVVIGRA